MCPRPWPPKFYLMNSTFESLFIEIGFKTGECLTVGTIYRPPSSNLKKFNKDIESKILHKLNNTNLIISGDLNINLLSEITEANLQFAQIMSNKNLQNIISYPTRRVTSLINGQSSESVSIIDQTWTNISELPKSFVIEYHLTDHYPIVCSMNRYRNSDRKSFSYRFFSEEASKIFIKRFNSFAQSFEVSNLSNVEERFKLLIDFLTDLINELFPIISRTCKLKNIKSPWISKDLQKCIDKKYTIYRKYKRGLLPIITYKTYRNKLNKTLNLAKRIYYFKQFSQNLTSKELWNKLNKIIKPCKESNNIKLKCTEIESEDPLIIGDIMNDHFLSYNPPLIATSTDPILNVNSNPHCFFLTPTTPAEISELIRSMKGNSYNKSALPTRLLKLINSDLSIVLSKLFDLCLVKGEFPDCLKIAQISPIHKKDSKLDFKNYRPISILNPIAKLLEGILYRRLYSFFDTFNLITKSQFGFQRGKGTNDAALNLLYLINKAHSDNIPLVSVFLDLSKAFDSINHTYNSPQ